MYEHKVKKISTSVWMIFRKKRRRILLANASKSEWQARLRFGNWKAKVAWNIFRYAQELADCATAPYKEACGPAVAGMECAMEKAYFAPDIHDCSITCPNDPGLSSPASASSSPPATGSSVRAEVSLTHVLPFVIMLCMFYLSPRKNF